MRSNGNGWSKAIFEAWGQSPDGVGPDGTLNLMSSVAAKETLARLRASRPESTISAALEDILLLVAAVYSKGRMPNRQERNMAVAALQLLTLDDGPIIAKSTVRSVIASFDPGYWFTIVRDLIARFLTPTDVLESLEPALQADQEPERMFNALEGLRLYSGAVSPQPKDHRFAAVAERVGKRVKTLANSATPNIKSSAQAALRQFAATPRE